jgi:hypothetical protein
MRTEKGWLVDLRTETGERYRKVFRRRREAEAHEKAVLLAVAAGTFGREKKQAPTIAEFSAPYLEWCALHNKPGTLASKEKSLRVHLLPSLGALRLNAPELQSEVDRFVTAKLGEGLTPTTLAVHGAHLQKMLSLAAKRGLIQERRRPSSPGQRRTSGSRVPRLRGGRAIPRSREPQWGTWLTVLLRTGPGGRVAGATLGGRGSVTGRLTVRRTLRTERKGEQSVPVEGTPKSGKSRWCR